jgi:hypothetical protein
MVKYDQAVSNGITQIAAADTKVLAFPSTVTLGEGMEDITRDHVAMPFLSLLQGLSPEVSGSSDETIEGAKAGQFLNTVTKELFDGQAGIILQPVRTRQMYVEWLPRGSGGGRVAEHPADSETVSRARLDSKVWNELITPNGNTLELTYYLLCLLHRSANVDTAVEMSLDPVLLSITGTKIRPYKTLMTQLSTLDGGKNALFAHRVRAKAVSERNSAGQSYYTVSFVPAAGTNYRQSLIAADHTAYALGAQLRKASEGAA